MDGLAARRTRVQWCATHTKWSALPAREQKQDDDDRDPRTES